LGKYARLQQSDGVMLSEQEIQATGLIVADEITHQDEYFDFEISDILPFGSSVNIVLPLQETIPEFGIYRKYTEPSFHLLPLFKSVSSENSLTICSKK
jgi:hypothetical protein